MKSETLICGEELLVILDETGEISFKQLEEKFKVKGDELRELLKHLVKKEYLSWKNPLFINEHYISDDKIKLANKGMEVVLRKRDYFTEGEKIVEKKIKVIFDSNVYDKIAEGDLDINLLEKSKEKYEYYITHIQIDEINKCSDIEKRAKLFLFQSKLSPIIVPTESLVFGTSRFGEAKFSDGKLLEKLRKGNLNHTEDALIGETAIKNNYLLITGDKVLKQRVNSNDGKAVDLDEFKEDLK